MTYVFRFLPAVEEDALAGYTWYEEKARGLGEEFLRMFYACARDRIEEDTIVVFGLFHCARDPRTIRTQLQDRDVPEHP